jgi:hypothetical protein
MAIPSSTNDDQPAFCHCFEMGQPQPVGALSAPPGATLAVAGFAASPLVKRSLGHRIATVLCVVAFFGWCALPGAVWLTRSGIAWAQGEPPAVPEPPSCIAVQTVVCVDPSIDFDGASNS